MIFVRGCILHPRALVLECALLLSTPKISEIPDETPAALDVGFQATEPNSKNYCGSIPLGAVVSNVINKVIVEGSSSVPVVGSVPERV